MASRSAAVGLHGRKYGCPLVSARQAGALRTIVRVGGQVGGGKGDVGGREQLAVAVELRDRIPRQARIPAILGSSLYRAASVVREQQERWVGVHMYAYQSASLTRPIWNCGVAQLEPVSTVENASEVRHMLASYD